MNYEKLSKGAIKCMYVATGLGCAVLIAIIAALNIVLFIPKDIAIGKTISLAVIVLLVLNALISPYFRFHRYRYSINEECIDLKEGYLFVTREIVPIERLHKLETQRGPIDRMFKVAKLIVTTAGGDVTIRFLDEDKAEQIAEYLKRRINQIVIEQREEEEADGRK